MFEKLAKKAQGFLLVLLVGLISVVFVVQFGGPQAQGCGSDTNTIVAKVQGIPLTGGDFQASYALRGFNQLEPDMARQRNARENVLNGLVERSLLAHEARELGFEVTIDEAMRHVLRTRAALSSYAIEASYFGLGVDEIAIFAEDEEIDLEEAKRRIQFRTQQSMTEFGENQVDELLADRMRDTFLSTVQISPAEAWAAYVRDEDSAKIKYARFRVPYYRDQLEPTPEQVQAYLAEHAEEVDAEYQANQHRYSGLEEQIRARQILIESPEDEDEASRAAARGRAEGIVAQLRAGGDFGALARQHSDDTLTARRGGELGWLRRGQRPFTDALFELTEDGQVSDVVETSAGYHILRREAHREGDVPAEEAKAEIAERLYREARAEELAREAADDALRRLREGLTMDELQAELAGDGVASTEDGEPSEDGQTDEEPERPRDPRAPQVEETRGFSRSDQNVVPGVRNGSELAQAVFELSMEEPLPAEPLQLGQEFLIFQLTERNEATREEFTEEVRQRITSGLLQAKQREALTFYLRNLRQEAEADGRLRIDADNVLRYEDEDEGSSEEQEGEEESEPEEAEG